ncbi:MAG: phosphate ABC transporter permease subunit PstC [Streptosporangiaceae bacterium]|jgi:phosphate transport system permease protein
MSAATKADPATPAGSAHPLNQRRPLGDRGFQLLALAAGLLVLVILVLITYSTAQQSTTWFSGGAKDIFQIAFDGNTRFGAMGVLYGTVISSVIGLIIGVPVSVGIALLLTQVVPLRWSRPFVYVIDLLAVVPSVVWGLWGIIVLVPWLQKIYLHIASGVNGIPVLDSLFGGSNVGGASFFTAGLILAIMITPIISSLSREVIATVPDIDKEGAYALGATRWEMIRGAVWPHSQGGVVGAILVGLGRAMGETIAVALVIGASVEVTPHLFYTGQSIAAIIALQFGEAAAGEFRSALIGLGLFLFVLTIGVNLVARWFVERSARRARGE